MRENKLISQDKIIILISSISTIIYTAYILTIIFTPKYILSGVINGYIALLHSKLEYYNKTILIDFLSTIPILTIPILILAVYQISIAINVIINVYRGKVSVHMVKLMFGGGLASINICGLILGLFKILEQETTNLNLNLNYISSAGKISFGTTIIQIPQLMSIMTNQATIILATIIQTTIISIAYIHAQKRKT
ncbi:MAG: hypothetical protein QW743_07980 [Candidatus Methanomethylicia archaeon]